MSHKDVRKRGFKEHARLDDAQKQLADKVQPHDRSEVVMLEHGDGRVTSSSLTAQRDVPHYDRAAMDGYALRATDTVGASERSPEVLTVAEKVGPETVVRVHTGSPIPPNADAVIKLEDTTPRGDALEIFQTVASGAHIGERGEDVTAGTKLYERGQHLAPSDLAMLASVGYHSIEMFEPPDVAVIPTGEELVSDDPAPGEVVETNGLLVSRLVERWGGQARYGSIVSDDSDALKAAIQNELDADLIVTTGGSSVGERDLMPLVIDQLGDVLVHGVALRPGHPVAIGCIETTPIVALPGYPVACLVNAVQFVRPAINWMMDAPVPEQPTIHARLTEKLRSEPGIRSFARVSVEQQDEGWLATPTRVSGAGVLSSVTNADGWVVIPEAQDGVPADEIVIVERWEWPA